MKALFIILVLLQVTPNILAQGDLLNEQKYNNYRNNLKYFVKPRGTNKGDGLVAGARNTYNSSNNSSDILHFGDGVLYLGWYTGMLATEYKVLTNKGKITEAKSTLIDLYYALQAFDRLDYTGENYYSKPSSMNGFFVRTDALNSNSFVLNNHSYFNDFIDNPNDPGFPSPNSPYNSLGQIFKHVNFTNESGTNQLGEPSNDQIIHFMMGLALTYKLVPDNVSVTVNGQTAILDLKTKSKIIFKRLLDFVYANGDWQFRNPDGELCGEVTGQGGGIAIAWSYGYKHAAEFFDLDKSDYTDTSPTLWYLIDNSWLCITEDIFCQKFHKHQMLILSSIADLSFKADMNLESSLRQVAASEDWEAFYPLLYSVLHGKKCLIKTCDIATELDSAPMNNPAFSGGAGTFGWKSTLKYTHTPSEQQSGQYKDGLPVIEGNYNGLDYMLLYNLYQLRQKDNELITNMINPDPNTFHGDNLMLNEIIVNNNEGIEVVATESIVLMPDIFIMNNDTSKFIIGNCYDNTIDYTKMMNNPSQEIGKVKNQLNEDSLLDFHAYPNPVTDFLKISSSSVSSFEIELYSSFGQLLSSTKGINSESLIDFNDYSKGIYFVKIKYGEKVMIKKVIKQ